MKKIIGQFFLKLFGWKLQVEGDLKNLDRCILVVAPHTSNMDYLLGIATYWKLNKKLKAIIKDSHTKAFYGPIIKWIGAIGIDRSQKNDLVKQVVNHFKKEDFSLVITPEGSRSYSEKWKLGFYYMALEANVPIVLASGDYQKKIIQIGHCISIEELKNNTLKYILDKIETYYKDITPKFVNQYNTKIY